MGGGSIKKPTQKRSINFTTETLETLDKLAAKNHTTTSELVRGYVEKGLSLEGKPGGYRSVVYVEKNDSGIHRTPMWRHFRLTIIKYSSWNTSRTA